MNRTVNKMATIVGALAWAALFVAGCSSDGDSSGVDASSGDAGADQAAVDIGGNPPDEGLTPDATKPPEDAGGAEIAPVKMVRDKAVCPAGFAAPKSGDNDDFDVDGDKRSFRLRLPDPSASGPRPVLVYFHGTSTDGTFIADFGFADALIKKGFIVVGPYGALKGTVWPTWDAMRQTDDQSRPNADVAFFDKIVDCLAAHLEVDEKRIYVAGHSAGGIMTNRLLRERSQLLAGGVVASGIFDLTDPVTPGPLDEMAVLVTWGGEDDAYSGGTGGVEVPKFNFVEQAAIASAHYEQAAAVNQAHCHGTDLGHAWLEAIDGLIVDFLVAHPKGAALNASWTLPAAPSAGISCSEDAASYTPMIEVVCAAQSTPDCQSYCQGLADCAVENDTIRPVLGPQLAKVGFGGVDYADCAGCVTQCEQDLAAGGSPDQGVLSCMTTELGKAQCGAGIAGAMPLIDATNACCKDQQQSHVCTRFCQAILENSVAAAFFTSCAGWAP